MLGESETSEHILHTALVHTEDDTASMDSIGLNLGGYNKEGSSSLAHICFMTKSLTVTSLGNEQ